MNSEDWLVTQFEQNRDHMKMVAYRLLGSAAEAEDAVQETWIRVSRAGADDVANMGGWLTTIVARVSLNMLESRATRREEPLAGEHDRVCIGTVDPAEEVLLADSVGAALLVILDTLTPAERLAFVLHDMFSLSFDEIAPIVARSPAAARKLASRARHRVRRGEVSPDQERQDQLVRAFLAASRAGDFAALLAMLDPEIAFRADQAAVRMGGAAYVHGPEAVAAIFGGRAEAARVAWIDGTPGLVWSQAGQVRVVFGFTVAGGRVAAIEMIADPERISRLAIA